jgi:alpha-ketoglutarate-dependent taurine dioxygenase
VESTVLELAADYKHLVGEPRTVGLNADPQFSRLLDNANRKDLSPNLGTELRNVQLKGLSDDQIEDLAAFVPTRGVVVFRDQQISLDEHLKFAERLGDLQETNHPFSKGMHPAVLPIAADKDSKFAPGEAWHSDMCEEPYPPAYSILYMEKVPPSGGDTLYANMYAAYDKLSPPMKKFLEGKTAITRRGTRKYRGNLEQGRHTACSHPVIRTHPVTGWQMLFTNEPCSVHLDGHSALESEHILRFLAQHIEKSAEFQIRLHWEPNSVAIWDNRAVQHQAIWDYWPAERRGRRVAVMGSKPYYDPNGRSQAKEKGESEAPKLLRHAEE